MSDVKQKKPAEKGSETTSTKKPASVKDLLKEGEITISKMERPPERKDTKK